jgi:hypothetical protein
MRNEDGTLQRREINRPFSPRLILSSVFSVARS